MSKRLDIHKVIGLLLCMLFVACEQEVVDSPLVEASEAISFHVIQAEEDVASRSTDSYYGELVGNKVLRSDVSADTLAMGVYVSDMSENTSLSRGVPVTSDNLASLSVWASKQEEGKNIQSFFKNLKVSKNGSGSFESENTYYWPGAIFTLGFTAVSPYNPQGLQVVMDGNNIMPSSFVYEVPSTAEAQSDLMISTPRAYNGNEKAPVQLHFRHLCSAVNVKVGTIPQGSIEAITFKNIFNKGTYTLASNTWSVTQGSKADFAVDFVGTSTNYPTAGTETGNPQINDASATFMMIPQTLPDDAEIEITFLHSNTGKEETLKASLKGTSWVMGQTNNYLISITPDYILDFTTEQVDMQDAHYVMVPLTIKAKFLNEGWKLSGTASDGSKVTFCESLTALQQSGYWIEEDRGQETLTSTTLGDEVNVYAFLEENVTNEKRTIDLSLRPASNVYQDRAAKTLQIEQLCPAWNGNLGCERIEDGQYPWGFSWTGDMKITYTVPKNSIWTLILRGYLEWFTNYDYISTSGGLFTDLKVTIDFNQVTASGIARSETDGKTNTNELYNYNGVSDASDLIDLLKRWEGTANRELPANPAEFAARACAMKNKYNKTSKTTGGQTIEEAVLKEENFVWYLPASNEITQIMDADYPMNGTYWTSTSAPSGETQAYKYITGNLSLDDRSKSLKVRAVRKKP